MKKILKKTKLNKQNNQVVLFLSRKAKKIGINKLIT